ncbi:MAG: hypothetical protein OEM02_04160 [Desulfobulbaceae bacterium]|nr:hypothetical protein [Desulfobulbaceae bacterium]
MENIENHYVNRLLGTHIQEGIEAEHGEYLMVAHSEYSENTITQYNNPTISVPELVFSG